MDTNTVVATIAALVAIYGAFHATRERRHLIRDKLFDVRLAFIQRNAATIQDAVMAVTSVENALSADDRVVWLDTLADLRTQLLRERVIAVVILDSESLKAMDAFRGSLIHVIISGRARTDNSSLLSEAVMRCVETYEALLVALRACLSVEMLDEQARRSLPKPKDEALPPEK